ncbi:hypothetical protein DFAR_2210078 [Desulfarculales bacterium]
MGTSSNALGTQIWTALIALLLLTWLYHLSLAAWSLSNLAAMLGLNLFTYRGCALGSNIPIIPRPSCPSRFSYRSCPVLNNYSIVKQKSFSSSIVKFDEFPQQCGTVRTLR